MKSDPALSSVAAKNAPVPWHRLLLGQGHASTALALLFTAIYSAFGITRHQRFGSGSWDMGCYVHNLYLLAYGKPLVSSVLGDANFWGGTNHFMPSLVFAAPLSYVDWPEALILAQAALVAFAVVPLWAIGHRLGLSRWFLMAVSLAYLLSVGTQHMVNFDVHEIAPVPLLMFLSLLLFMDGRLVAGVLVLLVLSGCKESCILYASSIALVGAWHHPRLRRPLLAVAAAFVVWFVVVVGVIQPHFLEPGAAMLHTQRFSGGLTATVLRLLSHPIDALLQLFSPAMKASTWLVTGLAFLFLPLVSPTFWLLAAPNVAERFLSDKQEMWGLGFHYSLVLVACAAVSSLHVLAHVRTHLTRVHFVHTRGVERALAAVVVLGLASSWWCSPTPIELATLHKPYMADATTAARYKLALSTVPPCASVVAQNHFLPHLAHRQFIWQPERRFVDRADVVILDDNASPWPHSRTHVRQLIAALSHDDRFRVALSEDSTRVFVRNTFAGCGDVIERANERPLPLLR